MRVADEEGASALRRFVVGTLPEVNEQEPNDDYRKPHALATANVTVNGRLAKAGDVDCFGLKLRKGQTLVASVEAKEDEPVLVLLKAAPGPRPYLRLATESAEGKRAAALKAGQKVKGVGTFSTDALRQASVGISDVLLIEPAP